MVSRLELCHLLNYYQTIAWNLKFVGIVFSLKYPLQWSVFSFRRKHLTDIATWNQLWSWFFWGVVHDCRRGRGMWWCIRWRHHRSTPRHIGRRSGLVYWYRWHLHDMFLVVRIHWRLKIFVKLNKFKFSLNSRFFR